MRFKIKRLSLAMASGLALVLAACGGSETPAPAPAAPAAAPVAETPAAPAAETPAPVEAAAPAEGATYADFTGDPAKGKRVFAACMTCHAVQEGRNNVGPSLYQIVGRHTGSVEGFKYSDANKNKDINWTEENLFIYLENPQAFIPGTIMTYPGLRSPQDRADVIAYLKNPT
jgi:cytochrome c